MKLTMNSYLNTYNSNGTRLTAIYSNDTHGNLNNYPNLITGMTTKRTNLQIQKPFVFSAGDDFMYKNPYNEDLRNARQNLILNLLNILKPTAMTLGNHEFDNDFDFAVKTLKGANFNIVSTNIVGDEIAVDEKLIKKSIILEKDGEKFGVLGAFPPRYNLYQNFKFQDYVAGVKNDPNVPFEKTKELRTQKTLDLLDKEIDKLEKQGVNKIILLSHLGYALQTKMLKDKRMNGIDVVIGGHTHKMISGIHPETDKNIKYPNLFKTQANEPVVVTEAGKNGQHFGVLDVWFNKKGILDLNKISSNKVLSTKNYKPNEFIQNTIKSSINKAFANYKTIATLDNDFTPNMSRAKENTLLTNAITGIKEKLADTNRPVDFVLMNASNVRMGLKSGKQNHGKLTLPFIYEEKIVTGNITAKQLVTSIEQRLEQGNKKGDHDLYQFTPDVKYTIKKNGTIFKLDKLSINDENIDISKPQDKTYKFATSTFIKQGELSKELKNIDYTECPKMLLTDGLPYYVEKHKTNDNKIIFSNKDNGLITFSGIHKLM